MTNGDPPHDAPRPLSEEQLATLARMLDMVPSAIAFWDQNLHNVFANRSAYIEWFGMTPEQLRGQHARVLLGPEVFELNRPYMEKALAGEHQVFERQLLTPSGEMRDAQIEYTPYIVDGEVLGFVTIVVDVTIRASAERAARVTAERLATLTERQRIEQRAHEGILQDLFAVQLNIERARAAVPADSPGAAALDVALDRLDAAVADLRLVLGKEQQPPGGGANGSSSRPPATA